MASGGGDFLRSGVKFDFDIEKADKGAKAVQEALKGINASMSDVDSVASKLNTSTGKLETSFIGAGKEGQKFVAVLTDATAVVPKVITATERYTKVITRQEAAVKALGQGLVLLADREKERQRAFGKAGVTGGLKNDGARRELLNTLKAIDANKKLSSLKTRLLQKERELYAAKVKASGIVAQAREDERKKHVDLITAGRLRAREIRLMETQAIAARKLGLAYKLTGLFGKKAAADVLISWRSVGRLFVVQLLHQSVALLRRAFGEASRDAFEFTKRIAEIRTITDDATESTKDWRIALAGVSRTLPFKQIELAEAAYQALSNQVISTTKDLTFIREAGKLALVGVTDTITSVNALTSIINSFGQSILRTNDISATLFKTVELGRTRMEQLEQNLGRVSILSSRLGISFKDQQSALAALTIQGLKDNVSKTLLVNIMNKLIRPSERMKEIFDEWNVTSGQSAIATFGFMGVMERLYVIAGRSGDRMGELGEIFQRVRATIGAAGLDSEKWRETWEQFGDTADEFNEKVEEISKTTFVRLKQELTNVNTLLIKFGTTLNSIGLEIAETFGGLDNAVRKAAIAVGIFGTAFIVSRIATLIGRTVLALVELRVAMQTTGLAAAALTGNLGGFLTALATIGGTYFIVSAAHAAAWALRVQDHVDTVRDAFQDLHTKIEEDANKALVAWAKLIDEQAKKIAISLAIVDTELVSIIKSLEVDLEGVFDALTKSADLFGDSVTDALKIQLGTLRDALTEIEKALSTVTSKIDSNIKKIAKLNETIAEREAKDKDQGNPVAQAVALEGIGTVSALEEAKKIYAAIARDREQSADYRLQAEKEILRIELAITDAYKARRTILRDANRFNRREEKRLEAEKAVRDQEIIDNRAKDDAFKKAQDVFNDFDFEDAQEAAAKKIGRAKTGSLVDEEKRLRDIEKEILANFEKVGKSYTDSARAAGHDPAEVTKFEQEIAALRINIETDTLNQIDQLRRNHEKQSFLDKLTVIKKRQTDAETAILESRQDVSAEIFGTGDALARLEGILNERRPTDDWVTDFEPHWRKENRDKIQAQYDAILSKIDEVQIAEDELDKETLKRNPDRDKITKTLEKRAKALSFIAIETTKINKIRDQMNEKGEFVGQDAGDGYTGGDLVRTLMEGSETLVTALDAEIAAIQELHQIQAANEIIIAEMKKAGFERQQIDPVGANTTSIVDLTAEIILNIKALKALETAMIARGGIRKAAGGMINGPGGIDNVPAWLTAGEFVMNAQATRANLPVLQAMNNPRGYARGGRVQNINIGDITVTGGNTSQASARQIARDIKREISRGTLTL